MNNINDYTIPEIVRRSELKHIAFIITDRKAYICLCVCFFIPSFKNGYLLTINEHLRSVMTRIRFKSPVILRTFDCCSVKNITKVLTYFLHGER